SQPVEQGSDAVLIPKLFEYVQAFHVQRASQIVIAFTEGHVAQAPNRGGNAQRPLWPHIAEHRQASLVIGASFIAVALSKAGESQAAQGVAGPLPVAQTLIYGQALPVKGAGGLVVALVVCQPAGGV